MKYLGTEAIPVTDLRHYPGNARKHAHKQLMESVRLGQYRALVVRVDNGTKTVVCGNGTLDALIATGAAEALCELREFTDAEARRVNLADNKIAELGSDDPDLLAALLSQVEDYVGTGYSDKEIAKILGQEEMPEEGDAPVDEAILQTWGVIVECSNEGDQIALLREFADRGLNVRAISA